MKGQCAENKRSGNRWLPAVLSVAGSDPSGGAGIQQDLKVFHALGQHGAAAVTAVTVQDSVAVQEVQVLDASLVASQVKAVLADMAVGAVKLGMLGNGAVVDALAEIFRGYPHIPLIADPVMASTSGHALLEPEGVDRFLKALLPLCALVTPNMAEAELLTGIRIDGRNDMERAAESIWKASGRRCAVLVKGGHATGEESVDFFFDGRNAQFIAMPRVGPGGVEVHGTGCALSAAIAVGVARQMSLIDAVKMAKKLVHHGISNSFRPGRGSAYLAI